MRCINVILSASLVLVLVAGCQPRPTTEIYFMQSQERDDPESQSAYYTETNCTGPTTESISDTKSAFLDAYFYGVEVSRTTGLVSSDLSPEGRVGFAKGCISVKETRFTEGRKLLPIPPLTATVRSTIGLYRGEDPDLEFQIDGEVRMLSVLEPVGLASLGVLSSIDVKILEDPSIKLVGGKAVANSFAPLIGQGGAFWTFRLIFEEERFWK